MILGQLLAHEGLFRPRLAAECGLTEGSISRILADLRADGLVEELRRPAPYPGGPGSIVALRKDQRVAALEFNNDHLGFGLASLAGTPDLTSRIPVPPGIPAGPLRALTEEAIATLAAASRRHGHPPRQIAVSLPGFREARPNPILPLDAAWLEARLAAAFPGVPLALVNTVTAHAAIHLHGRRAPPVAERHLFVFLGRGVGGAWVDPVTAEDPIRAIEIGHVVLDPEGPECRCGHRGCLEASAAAPAIAALCGIEAAAMEAAGADWPALIRMTPRREAALRGVLHRLGLVLGNALNLQPVAGIALCGWPAALPVALRDAIAEGMDRSLFGGLAAGAPPLRVLPPTPAEPAAALAYAVHRLIQQGGIAPRHHEPARIAG